MKWSVLLSFTLLLGCQASTDTLGDAPGTSSREDPRVLPETTAGQEVALSSVMNRRSGTSIAGPPVAAAAAETKPTGLFVRQDQPVEPAETVWEYQVVSLQALAGGRIPTAREYPTIQANLNRFGIEGWEVCAVLEDLVILKKPAAGW